MPNFFMALKKTVRGDHGMRLGKTTGVFAKYGEPELIKVNCQLQAPQVLYMYLQGAK